MVKTVFIGDRYESIYDAMISLIDKIEDNDYHGHKLKALLKGVAKDGRLVGFPTRFPCNNLHF